MPEKQENVIHPREWVCRTVRHSVTLFFYNEKIDKKRKTEKKKKDNPVISNGLN